MSSPANVKEISMPTSQFLETIAARQTSPERFLQPVGIIGPGDGGSRECAAAYQVAHTLARAGMAIVCGGRSGVMEAASRGAYEAGGIAIGILPEDDVSAANRFLSVAIPTGMGEMRNAIIARSSICLVAIGGGMGTISEMALGLKWGKTVFALYPDVDLPGLRKTASTDELLAQVCAWLALASPANIRGSAA